MTSQKMNLQPLADTMKLLVYKEDNVIFQKLDFEDNATFLEPMLFAYFNNNYSNIEQKKGCLKEILQGYFVRPEEIQLKYLYNNDKIAYLPNLGYYNKLSKKIAEIEYLASTQIELLKHKSPLLYNVFRNSKEIPIDSKLIELNKTLLDKYNSPLNKAVQFIKKSSPEHFKLIESCCKKIVLFKTNPNNTNSFATLKAQGIAFLNTYQEDYDEVFFVDDIAHQTGHVIMFAFWFKKLDHFIIDLDTSLSPILQNQKEYRSFYVLFHALYTYYATILCLDNCIESNFFNSKQELEATARIGFYLRKYKYDLVCFEKVCKHFSGIENVIREPSINLYGIIKEKYFKMASKYDEKIKNHDYTNQPYNFTFRNFMEINC